MLRPALAALPAAAPAAAAVAYEPTTAANLLFDLVSDPWFCVTRRIQICLLVTDLHRLYVLFQCVLTS